ncbi:Hypothetical predicted protein, partial [Paramuricea clavata]
KAACHSFIISILGTFLFEVNGLEKLKGTFEGEKLTIHNTREKRARKTNVTKIRHNLEKLCAQKSKLNRSEIEAEIEALWDALETSLSVMDELCSTYIKSSQAEAKEAILKEQENFESDGHQTVEKAQQLNTITANVSPDPTTTQTSPPSFASNFTGITHHRLKPLTVPVYYGDKTRFEDFWALFISLVDEGSEPVNIKMARLRQSLSGNALDAIRGLGVTAPEYNEAKDILKSKFGGQRRQLQAYLDQLENMPTLKNNDIQSFEKFADLVRPADGKHSNDDTRSPVPDRWGVAKEKHLCFRCLASNHVVWLKANGRKVKVNAILDDASNETFLNEQVAGVLGLQEPYKTVKVHVLNNEIETFQSMPVENITGSYK